MSHQFLKSKNTTPCSLLSLPIRSRSSRSSLRNRMNMFRVIKSARLNNVTKMVRAVLVDRASREVVHRPRSFPASTAALLKPRTTTMTAKIVCSLYNSCFLRILDSCTLPDHMLLAASRLDLNCLISFKTKLRAFSTIEST